MDVEQQKPIETEEKNQAGTAPRAPTDGNLAKAHAKHEERRELAERVQARMEQLQASGAQGYDAKRQAEADVRNAGHAPENRSATVPENRSDAPATDQAEA